MAEARPDQRRGDPTVAVLLTWFLPGSGHLYLGRLRPGVVALVLVEGLYALGWLLSHGRVFELLDPELRGPLATVLTPEVGNLGAMIAQLKVVGWGLTEPRPFPSTMALGGMLTALSGIANAFLMVHAHVEARTLAAEPHRGPHPAALVALAWAVPGLGHVVQGRRLRGVLVFLMLVGFFALGTWFAEGTNLSRERHFYYWSGQALLGLPALVGELVLGPSAVTHDLRLGDVGLLYACMAGLLNVLALLDVYGVAERRWFGRDEEPAGSAAEGAAA